MTGRPTQKYRSDDIRRYLGWLTGSPPARALIDTAVIAASSVIVLQLALHRMDLWTITQYTITTCLAVLTIETSLRLLAERFEFFLKPWNVLTFAILFIALFTPFRSILLLRLFPILHHGVVGFVPSARFSRLMIGFWLLICFTAGGAIYAQYKEIGCGAWVDCTFGAFRDTWT